MRWHITPTTGPAPQLVTGSPRSPLPRICPPPEFSARLKESVVPIEGLVILLLIVIGLVVLNVILWSRLREFERRASND